MLSLGKYFKGDRVIWIVVGLLSLFGVLAVYSSTGALAYVEKSGNTEFYLIKHVSLLFFGLLVMWVAHSIDFRYYSRISQLLLLISIPLLVYTLFYGVEVNSARRWIILPVANLSFQTSDLAKLALIMYIARFLSKRQETIGHSGKTFWPILGYITLICVLIAPADLSTAAVLFLTCLLLLFIGRVPIKHLLYVVGIGAVIFPIVITVILTKPEMMGARGHTWKARIEQYTDRPDEYAGTFQNDMAKIAIAEGGVLGKGPGKSTQRNLLPSPYSDFIYAVIIEEYGSFLGGLGIIFLYLLLLWRVVRIVLRTPKAFGALLAVGLCFSLITQAFINMAVAVHLLPVTGLPLPLVSKGGTSMLFTSMAFGIILSVSKYDGTDEE